MIHLTETGFNAGRPFCLTDRVAATQAGDTFQHGAYAPLHKDDVRALCCPECLKVWALEAYDDTDTDMPEWVAEIRIKEKTK